MIKILRSYKRGELDLNETITEIERLVPKKGTEYAEDRNKITNLEDQKRRRS